MPTTLDYQPPPRTRPSLPWWLKVAAWSVIIVMTAEFGRQVWDVVAGRSIADVIDG